MTALMTLGAGRTTRDLVETESWRGLAAHTLDRVGLQAALVVDLTLSTHERADTGLYPTVEHGAVRAYTDLAITWTLVTVDGRVSRPHQPDRATVEAATPILGDADWRGLVTLWERWHCQGMAPGCTHQTPPPGDVAAQLAGTDRCPVDGYRFGSAWLVRDLPPDIRDRARQVGAVLEAGY